MRRYEAGQVYGRLTLVRRLESVRNNSVWECVCECGSVIPVLGFCLGNGNTRSCGCLRDDMAGSQRRTHGQSRIGGRQNPTYMSWHCMINRCYNPHDKSFGHYNGRGITVCDEWRYSFPAFVRDMGERPAGKTIERLNNDAGYSPGNCVWAGAIAQSSNKRSSRYTVYNGDRVTIAEAARRAGMRPKAFLKSIGEPHSRKSAA